MACMLPLITRRQMRDKSKMRVERDSLVRLASVETGEVLRHSELTREHAGDTDYSQESGVCMI